MSVGSRRQALRFYQYFMHWFMTNHRLCFVIIVRPFIIFQMMIVIELLSASFVRQYNRARILSIRRIHELMILNHLVVIILSVVNNIISWLWCGIFEPIRWQLMESLWQSNRLERVTWTSVESSAVIKGSPASALYSSAHVKEVIHNNLC